MSGETLRIERTFQAPAQAVFDAWTSEEVMRRWFHGQPGWETPEAQVDLRVGGAVRVVMRDPRQGRRARRRRPLHRDRPPDPPGVHLDLGRRRQGDADRDRLRGGRRRHHGALHPQRPPGRRVGPHPRRRLDHVLRQPRARAGGGRYWAIARRRPSPQAGGFSANCGASPPISCQLALYATWR